jgi:hypothetical protein
MSVKNHKSGQLLEDAVWFLSEPGERIFVPLRRNCLAKPVSTHITKFTVTAQQSEGAFHRAALLAAKAGLQTLSFLFSFLGR